MKRILLVATVLLVMAAEATAQRNSSSNARRQSEIRALEQRLAMLRTRLSEANGQYRAIQVQLRSGIDRIDRANTVADGLATAASVMNLVGRARQIGVDRLTRQFARDQIVDLTGITSPSYWASLVGRFVNLYQNRRFRTVRDELMATWNQVESSRIQVGSQYVRQINQVQAQLNALRAMR